MQESGLRIAVFGDISPGQNKDLFTFTLPEVDVIIGNLECVLIDSPSPVKKAGPVLYSPRALASTLKDFGFSALSLANNHIRDCGDLGVHSTIEACKHAGIAYFGAGNSSETAVVPFVYEKEGIRVAFVSYAEREFNYAHDGKAGSAVFDPFASFDQISSLKRLVDAVVVLYHGGIEDYRYPSPQLRRKCRKMVEAGADAVMCQHSHCIGTREIWKGGEILYGQGNSVFGFRKGKDSWNQGLLAFIDVRHEGVSVTYKVLEATNDNVVRFASEEVALRVLTDLKTESEKLEDEAFIISSWKKFCEKRKAYYFPLLYGLSTNSNRINRLLNNRLIDMFYSRHQKNVTHNLIRCDSHREVLETLFEEYDY